MRRATVLFRTEGSAGNVLAVGLWRAEDGTTPIHTSEAGDETFLVLSGE
jgi:quercetin dioxygenase-like cupin family protein